MRDLSPWLPDLDPPPGGLARLRRSVQIVRPQAYWRGVGIAACALLVLASVGLPAALQRYRSQAELSDALRQAVQPDVPNGLQVVGGAAIALESGQPGVQLYLVQSARAAAAAPR